MKSYYIIYQGDIEKALKDNNIDQYMVLNSQLVVIYVPDDFKEENFDKIIEVAWWGESMPMSSLIELTNNIANGEDATIASGMDYIYKNPYTDIKGRGILVAIIDSGVNYLHPDLIDEDGKSKIISLWDQTKDGKPPEGYIFGTEYTNEDLNTAISNNDGSLSVDNIGTGTLAAGIVAGNGKVDSKYKGVATEAKLVVVKLREYYGTYSEGKVNYSNTDFLAAIKYILDVADKIRLPLVVNLTIGTMSSSTTEIHILDTFNTLNRVGNVVVSGAGNEGNTDTHYSGTFDSLDQVEDVTIQVGEQQNIDIILSGNGPDKIAAQIISPSGEVGYKVRYYEDNYIYRGKFNLENTSYSMRLIYPWIASGKQRLEIRLRDIKPGVWILRLTPEFIVSGQYDIYLPNKNIISEKTRFIDPDSIATITMYGAERDYITIGTFNDKTDSMWIGSSKGPIRGVGIKPDIVAPGVDIIGTSNDGEYNTGTGTGVSSSVISGVLAIMMEYLLDQTTDSRLVLYPEVLKTYLMLGATKKDIYTYPNISQGYGILNLKRTIEEIANNL